MTPLLNIMTVAVKKVADNVIRDFSELEYLLPKPASAATYAQHTQQRILDIIYKDLSRIKPNYNFVLGDEVIKGKDSSNFFYIHGIINLNNFTHHLSLFSIDLSLVRDNNIFAAVSYNPILGSIFYAEKNAGAFANKKKLRYTPQENGIVAVNKDVLSEKQLDDNPVIITNSISLDLCYLALGTYKAVRYNNLLIPFNNIMTGVCIAEEAGVILNRQVDLNNNITFLSSE